MSKPDPSHLNSPTADRTSPPQPWYGEIPLALTNVLKPAQHCPGCDYSLHGLYLPKPCPECGHALDADMLEFDCGVNKKRAVLVWSLIGLYALIITAMRLAVSRAIPGYQWTLLGTYTGLSIAGFLLYRKVLSRRWCILTRSGAIVCNSGKRKVIAWESVAEVRSRFGGWFLPSISFQKRRLAGMPISSFDRAVPFKVHTTTQLALFLDKCRKRCA